MTRSSEKCSPTPTCGGEDFVAVARIARPQGRKGEVVAELLTDFPSRFQDLHSVFIEDSGQAVSPVTLESAWLHKGRVVLKFSGTNSIDEAEKLRGRYVFVPRKERAPLPEDQYYVSELTGCRVVVERDGKQTTLGTVSDVERTGGVDVLQVSDGSREVLIPLAQSICRNIDLKTKVIVVDPPEDLLDLNPE